jgi:hypothetical protein
MQAAPETNIGSPGYMSPEQIMGGELGPYSDMFALGVVTYELFTGCRPFVAESLPELFRKIIKSDPVAPSSLRSDLPRDIDDVLWRMLAKSPQERYPSWADLALDIAKVGRLSVFQRAISDREKYLALRKLELFDGLDDGEIWQLAHAGRWSRLPARQVVVREHDVSKTLFFLASGQAKVVKGERLLGVLGPGEYFGELAFVKAGGIPRQATVESLSEVTIAEFEPSALDGMSANCRFQLTRALLNAVVERLTLANERIAAARV